jgi:hypothetical protein
VYVSFVFGHLSSPLLFPSRVACCTLFGCEGQCRHVPSVAYGAGFAEERLVV